MVVVRGEHQRRTTVEMSKVHIGAILYECLNDLFVTILGSSHECGEIIPDGVHVDARSDQCKKSVHGSRFGGVEQVDHVRGFAVRDIHVK